VLFRSKTSVSISLNGIGRSTKKFTKLKITVLTPMARAIVRVTMAANARSLTRTRRPKRTSCSTVSTGPPASPKRAAKAGVSLAGRELEQRSHRAHGPVDRQREEDRHHDVLPPPVPVLGS